MTNKVAHNHIENRIRCINKESKEICTKDCSECELIIPDKFLLEAYGLAVLALEKQMEKKPIENSCTEKTHYKCKCGYTFLTKYSDGYRIGNKPNYCERCGQAMDWGNID